MKEPSAQRTHKGQAKTQAAGALTRPPSSRLLRTADFRTVYDKGIRLSGPLFAAFCLARPASGVSNAKHESAQRNSARLGLTVPRAVGNAVVRNRIKRRFREAFRLHRAEIGVEWDIVLNPRKSAATVPWEQLERAFRKIIERCAASSSPY